MTKAELISALNEYDEDDEVLIGLEGFDTAFCIDEIEEVSGKPMLVNELTPSAYELRWLAQEYYDANYRKISSDEIEAFEAWRDLL